MAKEYKDLIVGLDIGTAKVMAVVAEVQADGELRIAGLGVAPSHGLKRGVVVNIDATVQSIQQALKEAEMMAACKITSVYTGITGSHIRGQNSTGMVIVRDNREVTPVDVTRVVETAKAINIPGDQRLLLVEPQEFVIDGHEVKEPIGMSGSRLEVKVHIVTGAQSAAENIIKCVRRCGLEVERLVLNPSASAAAVLTDDEKQLGVAVDGREWLVDFVRDGRCHFAKIIDARDMRKFCLKTTQSRFAILEFKLGRALMRPTPTGQVAMSTRITGSWLQLVDAARVSSSRPCVALQKFATVSE